MAELRHVPREVIREFSTPTRAGRRAARRAGRRRLLRRAGRGRTRRASARSTSTSAELREDWRARAAEHGLGNRELQALLGRARHRELSRDELLAIAQRMLGPDGLTEKRTAFSDPEAVMAWAEAHASGRVRRAGAPARGTAHADRRRRAASARRPSPGRPARYSTAELVAVERAALALVERGRDAEAPSITEQRLDEIERADRIALSDEQEAMVREVATSPSRVVCVVGLAGAGKTTATHAVAQVFAQAGIDVLGAAPSGVAAEKLQDETGIPATTLHRLLDEARTGGGLPSGCVLVVDEAGMAETRILAPVLELVEQASAKAILIGDPHQLPAVGAGGLFAGIVERHGAVELTENRRQRDELERDALARVRAGVGRDYLAYAEKRERLVVSESPVTTRARLLADWWEHARDDLAGNVMLALRRRDVAELNQLARALMDADGRLGTDRLTVADREFAAGDRVVCLRNSDRLGVKNGTRGTVERDRPRQAHADDRHRPRPDRRAQPPLPRRPATSATPTRSPATPPRASPSSAPSSSAPARHACRNGATSRSRARARRPASTSPARRASTKATSTTSTTATRSPASAAHSKSPPSRSSPSTSARLPSGPRHDARPEIERLRAHARGADAPSPSRAEASCAVEDARRGRTTARDCRAEARAVRSVPQTGSRRAARSDRARASDACSG